MLLLLEGHTDRDPSVTGHIWTNMLPVATTRPTRPSANHPEDVVPEEEHAGFQAVSEPGNVTAVKI